MNVLTKLRTLFSTRQRVDLEKRFHRIAPVGQGSMSKLWRARDLLTGRTVALKVLDKQKTARLMARDYGGAKRPTEGEVAVALRHPHVVLTYEHNVSSDDEPFLVMEFIDGPGLSLLMDTKAPALQGKRIHYLIQAAEGLAYIHEQNYIHRDICPRNMLIDSSGVLKLIDFGLTVPNTPQFRRPGNRTGTATYMAPELIRREPTDERIDVFSFGVTAYECLVGRMPWDAGDTLQRMIQHMNSPPRDPREVRSDLDEELAKLLLHGIAQSPKKRIGSMKDFLDALRSLKRQDY
jgi:serine/threonine protein kinase